MTVTLRAAETRQLAYDVYVDKVLGGWIGKSLGGIVGAPFESHKMLDHMTVENCWPSTIFPNDDLDIQVAWLEMLEEVGPQFTSDDLIAFWQDRCWYNFAEYGFFLYNAQRGIAPPLSGRYNNICYRESMGCPIRAEIWGMVTPGNPALAATFARMDGELDHIDTSVWAEQFWAAATAEAFFASSLEEALAAGKAAVPRDSVNYRLPEEVQQLREELGDWQRVWKALVRRYGHRDSSKGVIDFAFTLLSLYEGGGDLQHTIVTAINCGWDTDCTAATAGALVGVLYGGAAMPADWVAKMGDRLTCDINVKHKTALLTEFAADTCAVGLEMAQARNAAVTLTEVPAEVCTLVQTRAAGRRIPATLTIDASYPVEPALTRADATTVTLDVRNLATQSSTGELAIIAPDGVIVSPTRLALSIAPQETQQVTLTVRHDAAAPVLWDKNLLQATWTPAAGEPVTRTFGVVGARQWQVYGPYWDAYDTERFDECPYRNDKVICHPFQVKGCGYLMCHQFARLDRSYLDEARLRTEDIPDEEPYLVERGEDHVDAEHLGGFLGEACYYFVRNITARTETPCNVMIGATGPFVVWLDGEEVYRSDYIQSWFVHDFQFAATFGPTPRRLVIKAIRPTDDFRFSLCCMKQDVPGDKTIGHSYILDVMGDVLG